MAIAYVNSSESGNVVASVTSLTWAHDATGCDLLVVGVVSVNGAFPTGVTYNGVALTSAHQEGGPNFFASLWYLASPASGSNNVVVSWGASQPRAYAAVVGISGANTSSPLDVAGGSSASATNTGLSKSLTTTADGCLGVCFLTSDVEYGATANDDSGQTRRQASDLYNGQGFMSTEGPVSTGSNAMGYNWSSSGNTSSLAVAYFAPAAATGHPTIKRYGGVPHAAINRGVW